ncbi:MAG: hypothetical protein WBQ94_17875, partial [Terracidiphilus sp.]
MYRRGMNSPQSDPVATLPDPPVAEGPGFFVRVFNRIFTRHLMNAALLVLLALYATGILFQPELPQRDADLWWHLADARILTTTHTFIHVEPYSFSVAAQSWINPEWLSEMPFWLGYRTLGLTGIYLVTVLALCANILLVYWRSCLKARHAGAALGTAALGFLLMTISAGPRTILIAYLALSVELAILEATERGKTGLLWLLPPLFCVWINLHGSWIIGLGLLGLYILCGAFTLEIGVFEQKAFSNPDRTRLILVFLASMAALMLNPYGWRLIWNPIDMLLNQKQMMSVAQEWQPLNVSTGAGIASWLCIALMIVANCVRGRKWKVYELAFVFFAWFEAFNHIRFTFLACLLVIPMLTVDVARSFCSPPDEKTIPVMNALFAAVVLCIVAYFFPTEARLQKSLAAQFPLQSIAAIQPSWRTFNQDAVGGMMAFNVKPTFYDTRYDTFVHHGVLADYLGVVHLVEPLKILDKYRVDHVLVQAGSSLSTLIEHAPGWRVEMREGAGSDAYE